MVSTKLKSLFAFSIPVFIFHGIEEIIYGLPEVDQHVAFIFGHINSLETSHATFLVFQIMLWLTLIISAILISSERWRLRMFVLPGLIYLYEFHHFWKAFEVGGYYPGLVTACAFPVLGSLYWSELLSALRKARSERTL